MSELQSICPPIYPPKCQTLITTSKGETRICGRNRKYNQDEGIFEGCCKFHEPKRVKVDTTPPSQHPERRNYTRLLKAVADKMSGESGILTTKNGVRKYLTVLDLEGRTKTQFMKDYLESRI